MHLIKLPLRWTNEAKYRREFEALLEDGRTRSMRSLGGRAFSKEIFLSGGYVNLIERTARERPVEKYREELRGSLRYLCEIVQQQVFLPFTRFETTECLIMSHEFVEWMVDYGEARCICTVFVRADKIVLVTTESAFALDADYLLDRLLLETEIQHLTGAQGATR